MRREELLARIRQAGGIATADQADRVLRVVIQALKSGMTEVQARNVASYLSDDYRPDWISDEGHPHDILEKEEMMFEPGIKH